MMLPQNTQRVFLAVGHTDMRKAINGLSIMVEQDMSLNPFYGDLPGLLAYLFSGFPWVRALIRIPALGAPRLDLTWIKPFFATIGTKLGLIHVGRFKHDVKLLCTADAPASIRYH